MPDTAQHSFETRREKVSRMQTDPYMEAHEPAVAPTMPLQAAMIERLDLELPVENRHCRQWLESSSQDGNSHMTSSVCSAAARHTSPVVSLRSWRRRTCM